MSGFGRRILGKTGLEVSPIGIGGGNAISSEDVLYAFERGINYFFFSSDLHHHTYLKSVEALKTLCQHGSAFRNPVVLATVSYVDDPEKLMGVLADQFSELKLDYIDVFHWGWITDRYHLDALFKVVHGLKEENELVQAIRRTLGLQQQVSEINQKLLQTGLVRYVGASFHSRRAARQAIPMVDVMMLRYNLAHLGADTEVFPYLSGVKQQDPGIVAFNVGHPALGLTPLPARQNSPDPIFFSVPEHYRFALSNPAIDLVLTGVNNRRELDAALNVLEKGPMSEDELEFMQSCIGTTQN